MKLFFLLTLTTILKMSELTPNSKESNSASPTVNNVHLRALDEVFGDLDLSTFPTTISPNAPPDVLANYVLENVQTFKKKKLKKTVPREIMEHTTVDLISSPCSSTGNLLDEFINYFQSFFESESSLKDGSSFDKKITFQLLRQEFPRCRALLIEHLVEEFHGRFSLGAAICLFVESNYAHLVKKYFLHIEDNQWNLMTSMMPTPWKRRKIWIDPSGPTHESYQTFRRFLTTAKNYYAEIFVGERISRVAENIKSKVKNFTCAVCFDEFPQKSAILCSFPEVIDLVEQSRNLEDEKGGPHKFCLECVRGQALAATQEMPLAEGGVGLKCMYPSCENPILFSKCRSLIPYQVRKLLNDRIWEEVLGTARLENLQRCTRCNYAVQIEMSKSDMKVFDCLKCGYKFCRVCEREWDERHFGKPCEELDELEKIDVIARKYIQKMNEAVIRKCHKCSLPYVKLDGCNCIYCRCGATQCYVCQAPNINYSHFCSHFRNPGQLNCKSCKKKCCLWTDVDVNATAEVERIRADALANSGIMINAGQLLK